MKSGVECGRFCLWNLLADSALRFCMKGAFSADSSEIKEF